MRRISYILSILTLLLAVQLCDNRFRDSTLTSTVDACIDLCEWVLLLNEFLPYSLVVDSTKHSPS